MAGLQDILPFALVAFVGICMHGAIHKIEEGNPWLNVK